MLKVVVSRDAGVEIDFVAVAVMGIEVEVSLVGVRPADAVVVTVEMSLVGVGPGNVVADIEVVAPTTRHDVTTEFVSNTGA